MNWAARIRVKIERAKKHIVDLDAEVRAFLDTRPYEFLIETNPETPEFTVTFRATCEPPLEFGAIAGDAIHNLRSSLDMLLYALIRTGQHGPWKHFPMFKSSTEFEAKYLRKVKGTSKEILALIKALKPYKGGNDSLWRLHGLDIIDKHMLPLPIGIAYYGPIPGVSKEDFGRILPSVTIVLTPRPYKVFYPLNDKADIRFSPLKVDMNAERAFQIATAKGEIVEGQPLISTLHQLTDLVTGIVESFTPFLG